MGIHGNKRNLKKLKHRQTRSPECEASLTPEIAELPGNLVLVQREMENWRFAVS
jgi:hypothetical protein